MTSNYSLLQPQPGGDVGTWGGLLNNGTFAAADAALGSSFGITATSTDVALTAAQFQNAVFFVTGALTSNRNITIPLSPNSATVACGGRFVVVNETTGPYSLTILTVASGSVGVVVPQGFTAFLYSDGVNVGYGGGTGLPAFAAAINGNPNGNLAGTAGSVNTNAQLAYDYTNKILYVCTTTGNAASAVWTNVVAISLTQPALQGYLTPTSLTPIIPGDSVAGTNIFYTPYQGTWAAVHNGASIVPYRFTQMQLSLSTSQASGGIYDVFLCYNAGVPVIGTGPSWQSGGGSVTPGSCSRGTGTALVRDATTGLWVNNASMSVIYNTGGGNNTITVAGGQGIFLGSIWIDATAGQVSCYRGFGQSRKWGISNAYNRAPVVLLAGDGTASWAYNVATPRPSNNNTANSASVFSCLPEEDAKIEFQQVLAMVSSAGGLQSSSIGIGVNSTSVVSGTAGTMGMTPNPSGAVQTTLSAKYEQAPFLGINTFTSLETGNAATANTFSGTQTSMSLRAAWKA